MFRLFIHLFIAITAYFGVSLLAQDVRPLDWSKLDLSTPEDDLSALCVTVMEHTQKDQGKDWLEKIASFEHVNGLLDIGNLPAGLTKRKRRSMEDCIRPMTSTARTLALALRTGQYLPDKAGADAAEIEKQLPLVLRSLAKDHQVNGGIGKDTWGDTWQSAMWAGQMAQAAWIIWEQLSAEDQKLIANVLIHEANRFLNVPPPTSDANSNADTKGEENAWNGNCLMTAATMLANHPNEAAWREQAITYYLNAVATPHDLNSDKIVDGKPLSERLVGYCITEDYAVGNHKAYPHPGYTTASYGFYRQILFSALAGVKPAEALLYNAAPIYRMFVDHQWPAPPCTEPGGSIYREDGSIYWPIEKEAERAGRFYLWFRQDVMADTFGFDQGCSTRARHWANLHGQLMVDALTGKPTPVKLESYHKGAFFKTALTSYLVRRLLINKQLAPVQSQKASPAKTNKPNVLFISIDDLRPELGCYGQTWIKSPNIDRLAERGTTFTRAYCQVTTCGASRASLLTGLRPTSKRFLNYQTYAEKDAPGAITLPEEFRQQGYHCISNGKIFHHAEDTADRSWSETPWRPDLGLTHSMDPASKTMISKKQRGPVFESPDVPDNAYRDGQVTDKTISDLKRLKQADKPFFLACGFWKPHLPFYAPKKYWDLYSPEDIALAENQSPPKNAPKSLKGSGEIRAYHYRDIKYNSEEWHRSLRHGYYACV
ncbi:MAG: sulfatase-like hydrolase/transferase, partial [Verrucomicrobiota bacterium]